MEDLRRRLKSALDDSADSKEAKGKALE